MNDFDTVNMNKLQKAVYYFREYGWEYTKNRALKKLGVHVPEESEYMNWLRKRLPGKKELNAQKNPSFPKLPKVDLIIDETPGLLAGSTEKSFLLSGEPTLLLQSVKRQSYPAVEEIRSGKKGEDLRGLLEGLQGELVVFAQADTILSPSLFYAYAKQLNERAETALFYTDEDCGTADGKHRMKPYFKPDIAPELLHCFQYIGGVFAVRRTLLDRVLSDSKETDFFGNYWYDLIFVLLEELMKAEPAAEENDDFCLVHPRSASHIAKPLFTKVVPADFDGFFRILSGEQRDSIERHLKRTGAAAETTGFDVPGFYHVRYALPEKRPLVSVLIPSKDHFEDLDVCIRSLLTKNTYAEFEIIIAENNSTQPETFAYYDRITGESYDADRTIEGTVSGANGTHRIVVTTWKGAFNYSAINNFAAKQAKGELLLFLNNDTEIRDEQALMELVASATAPGFGGAGAMLYYEDGTIQHGGVVFKIGGFAANALWSLTDRDEQYYPYSVTAREMSCCTAACLMLKKEAFAAAGGFDEELAVALNDVDLCLKVRRAGYKIMFNPWAKLYHYESKSRGMESTPEKQERFNREIALFQSKWQEKIDRGDPYYNVNQTLHYANYAIELAEDNRGRYQA